MAIATTLMIFGLVTMVEVELHAPFSIMRSALHWAMTCLILMPKGGQIRRRHIRRCRLTCIVDVL